MTETTTSPITIETQTFPGLARQNELQGKIRFYAKWQVFFAVLAGIFSIAAIVYSEYYTASNTCNAWDAWNMYSFNWDSDCIVYKYPSYGVGLWSSIATAFAGGLALWGTGSNLVRKQRIACHMWFALIAVPLEIVSSSLAISIAKAWEQTDTDYLGMIVFIAIVGFVKIFLLCMSVRLSYQLVPDCCGQIAKCNQELFPTYVQGGRGGSVVQPGGIYNYPATGVGVQPQGGTMMMTAQDTMVMQPGYQMTTKTGGAPMAASPPSYTPVATDPTTYTADTAYAAPTNFTTYLTPTAPTPDPTSTVSTTQPTTYTYTADVPNETKPPPY